MGGVLLLRNTPPQTLVPGSDVTREWKGSARSSLDPCLECELAWRTVAEGGREGGLGWEPPEAQAKAALAVPEAKGGGSLLAPRMPPFIPRWAPDGPGWSCLGTSSGCSAKAQAASHPFRGIN